MTNYLSLHYHLVFSTKRRHPLIEKEWRERLHAFIGGVVRNLDGIPECVGGTADHLHLLVGLKATHRLSDFLRDLKATSSRWVREVISLRDFEWQDGYGAFTVSVSNRESVVRYIANQEAHHATRSFADEMTEIGKRVTGDSGNGGSVAGN
jgi:putative transposase